jgi:hypothetical protein
MRTKWMLAGALTSASLAAASLGLGMGTAQAIPSQPHEWCPGMPMHNPPGPGESIRWDMNVCHTWQLVKPGMGNVPGKVWDGPLDPVTFRFTSWHIGLEGSGVWEGPNIPPGAALECNGSDMFTGIPIPC